MRRTKELIIGLAAVIMTFSAASCMKEDNTLRYDNITMGNIVNGIFVSDQGNSFNVKGQTCPGRIDTMGRAFVICDVLNATVGGRENEYDVMISYMSKVLTKNAVPVSDIENMETYPNDAIILESLWISGGYLNMYFSAPVKRNSKQKHEINLVHDFKDGVYNFHIRHNAFGEVLKEDGSNGEMVIAGGYASFPISSIIKEDKADLKVEWNGYVISGSFISSQTSTMYAERHYDKSSYEHTPDSASAVTSALNLE